MAKALLPEQGKYIKKYVNDIPPELVKEFCRQRIFIRIKFMNLKKEETKLEKEKFHRDVALRKKYKSLWRNSIVLLINIVLIVFEYCFINTFTSNMNSMILVKNMKSFKLFYFVDFINY